MKRLTLALTAMAGFSTAALAADIYVLSSTDEATDNAVMATLAAQGHNAVLGVPYVLFDGTQSLDGFQTVLLQANANWTSGLMPPAGQQALINWVLAGGRLVTTEWVLYYAYDGGNFGLLGPHCPLQHTFDFAGAALTTFSVTTPDPDITAGVPDFFDCALHSYTGTEGNYPPQPGATVYVTTSTFGGAPALAGWAQGAGHVFNFTSTCGPNQLANPNFARLFANVMGPTDGGDCPADWNDDGIVNSADITSFITSWLSSLANTNLLADFNGDGAVNSADITSFITAWLAAVQTGC